MQVLFLDFDGVLNSEQSTIMYIRKHLQKGGKLPFYVTEKHMCPIACSNLQLLMEKCPSLNIVISSSWRNYYSLDQLRNILQRKCGISTERVIGTTSSTLSYRPRGWEIVEWLNTSKVEVEDYVILDDNGDMPGVEISKHFYQTNEQLGLTLPLARQIISRLGYSLTELYSST